MKLSFSDRKWTNYSFGELIDAAEGTGVRGIELHSVKTSAFGKRLDEAGARSLKRDLRDRKIEIACIDADQDAGDVFEAEYNISLLVSSSARIYLRCFVSVFMNWRAL